MERQKARGEEEELDDESDDDDDWSLNDDFAEVTEYEKKKPKSHKPTIAKKGLCFLHKPVAEKTAFDEAEKKREEEESKDAPTADSDVKRHCKQQQRRER
ncbi:hypothetical protein Bca52824_073816 [Brassica carinata]|uniref:Uncharacterized protein n=1 Tax=Brassica carinata TaxID=52824 RepID=A0A8X7QAU1_BRACI|nr:hypothetical protein Bca52824_073816 [Brassica carinata]